MKCRTYIATPGSPMYAMLVVFEARWVKPFHRISYQDGKTITSEHISRKEAADILRFWRSNPTLKVEVSR